MDPSRTKLWEFLRRRSGHQESDGRGPVRGRGNLPAASFIRAHGLFAVEGIWPDAEKEIATGFAVIHDAFGLDGLQLECRTGAFFQTLPWHAFSAYDVQRDEKPGAMHLHGHVFAHDRREWIVLRVRSQSIDDRWRIIIQPGTAELAGTESTLADWDDVLSLVGVPRL